MQYYSIKRLDLSTKSQMKDISSSNIGNDYMVGFFIKVVFFVIMGKVII